MSSYAFWNNKGGVGKSFLCFVAASEYAFRYPETDVYVIDLCPQANVSETLLGGYLNSPNALQTLSSKKPRATIAGYLESRLNSPFRMIHDISPYICEPNNFNSQIPENLRLICGDNILEIIAEAIQQTSQLEIPADAWKQVINWIRDLTVSLRVYSGERDTVFFIDCNSNFNIYTQLGLVASEGLIIPFTAEHSSLYAIKNIVALLYGISEPDTASYKRISFARRAKEAGISLPKLYAFILNRLNTYGGKFVATSKNITTMIKKAMDDIHQKNRHIFANPKEIPSKSIFIEFPNNNLVQSNNFIEIIDYESACVVAATTGTPLHKLQPGYNQIDETQVKLNPEPLQKYQEALEKFVNCL